ncbi:tyrosine-type recombinase/integrase [Streptomyces sp. NRRL B-1347]|uniref:tyrosine-type recombinase/integrase n=1 Tax=Streptomyces sp. NRRL B-1347 TaxID=1476877 RepID=UPI0004C6EA4C|nr:site-specific integrase [Streptomyces sp. NRRL B-1347]
MAYVTPRKNKDGAVTSHQVKWRLGGRRDGPQQVELFDPDEAGLEAARTFRDAVNEASQQWPAGWVKGKGFIDEQAELEDERYRFRIFARASVENRTGIEEHYRQACLRELDRWIFPTFGECDVRSTEHFSSDTVRAWVRTLEQARVYKGQAPKRGEPKWRKMSPKTIRNLHGLLSSILQEAVTREPPLRTRNPCELTRLPRADDDGAEGSEDIEFLTPEEVEGVISCLELRSDQLLATIKYGTGMRWSEITCLAPVCLENWGAAKPSIRVKRAWKRDGHGGYYIGAPKTKRGRRSVRVSLTVVGAVDELGGGDQEQPDRLYFTGAQGQRLHYSTFYDRWQRAVRRAKAQGLLPLHKHPTPHDLRHSHAAVLISEGRGLTYVQRRLGHESIKTTSDTYGHLLPEADDDAMDAIERSLGRGSAGAGAVVVEEQTANRDRVYVVAFPGDHVEAFWNPDDASAVAEQWPLDHPEVDEGVQVQVLTTDWWRRQQTDGLKDVREGLPGRRQLWVGSALYMTDGAAFSTGADLEEVAARWAWEWEEHYDVAGAVAEVSHLPGPTMLTEAVVHGSDREQVVEAFARARGDALAICGRHPGIVREGRQGASAEGSS